MDAHLIQNEGNTQQLNDSSNFSAQYFAVPLHFLVADETLKRVFAENESSPVSHDFRVSAAQF